MRRRRREGTAGLGTLLQAPYRAEQSEVLEPRPGHGRSSRNTRSLRHGYSQLADEGAGGSRRARAPGATRLPESRAWVAVIVDRCAQLPRPAVIDDAIPYPIHSPLILPRFFYIRWHSDCTLREWMLNAGECRGRPAQPVLYRRAAALGRPRRTGNRMALLGNARWSETGSQQPGWGKRSCRQSPSSSSDRRGRMASRG